eukprot:CAMPEP_0194766880 /NCGR_PEP_ID=MMETSP0323_2-20130528/33628_1 /TAXON_ID=2866 ORGANISM="Crypthecodinium cohnii, Strain Seligo" /NCGR_SAMPLE_ID=MMETSP0323_2 /ASSEMBLY_ACC=CAM_ASM_000346 /LENGTH=65 /DNA_ID=CAMNT_0039698175 /DNA_START=102 /DNA_END=299 /DNA_ORIENTATION=-
MTRCLAVSEDTSILRWSQIGMGQLGMLVPDFPFGKKGKTTWKEMSEDLVAGGIVHAQAIGCKAER